MEILDNPDELESLIETPPQVVEEELPEKYKGKSAAEIARMHQEAEKLIGRHAQEVSEVRKLADQLIRQNLQTPKQAQPEPEPTLDDVDFFADPKKAVEKAVASHPAVLSAQQAAVRMARQESLRNLKENHPDYMDVIADSEFKEWVGKSKVRQQLFAAADRNYDFDAADELLSTFKELKGRQAAARSEQVEAVKSEQERSLKAASNPAVGGSSEPTGKKIYRRADLIKLRMTNPDRYEALENEILAAYAEGRVR